MKNGPACHRSPHGTATAFACALIAVWLCACGARPRMEPGVVRSEPVRVATSGDYAPFSMWPADADEPTGFAPALLRQWARASGRRIEWVRFRWPELLDDARAGRFDLAAGGITVRPDRSIVGTFGVPIARTSAVVLVRSTPLSLEDLDSPDRRIAVNRGGHLERVARARFPKAVLLPTTPNEAVPDRLASGEVDAVVTDTRESPVWRRDHESWLQLGPLTHDRKAVFAAPGHAELVAEIDAWFASPAGHRTLLKLQKDELGIDPIEGHASVVAALIAAVDERLELMPDVARFKRAHGLPIDVPEREARVLDEAWLAVTAEAARRGVEPPDESKVRAFYRAQIEAAKAIQHRVVREGDAGAGQPRFDLRGEIRPALLRIGDRMARLLVTLREDPPHGIEIFEWNTLEMQGLEPAEIAAIKDALAALAPKPAQRRRHDGVF